jgi:hypothetical protein
VLNRKGTADEGHCQETKPDQEATTEQLVFAAMRDARSTLHEAVVAAGMSVLSAMLEEDSIRPRFCHTPFPS